MQRMAWELFGPQANIFVTGTCMVRLGHDSMFSKLTFVVCNMWMDSNLDSLLSHERKSMIHDGSAMYLRTGQTLLCTDRPPHHLYVPPLHP